MSTSDPDFTAQTASTGRDGRVVFSDLPYGTYTVTEETPPPGYVSLPNQFPDTGIVVNEANPSVTRTYTNTETKATIKLNKHVGTTQATISDSWPLATATDAAYFTFVLQRTDKENPGEGDWETAKDIYNQPVTVTLTNGEFSVPVPASEGNVTYKYRFVETISPDNTDPSNPVYFYYVADKPGVYTAATDPVTLSAGSTEDTVVHMYNRELVRLLISKKYYDVNTNGSFAAVSSNRTAKFQLYSYTGTGIPTADQLVPVGDPKDVGGTNVEWNQLELYDNGTQIQYFIKETDPTEGFVWGLTENQAATKTGAPTGYLRLDPTKLNGITWQTEQRNYRYAFPVRFAKKNFYGGKSDISGVKVTIYTDAACTQIAKDAKTGNDLKDIALPVITNSSQTLRYTSYYCLKPGQVYYYQENEVANYSFVEATNYRSTATVTRGGVIDLTGSDLIPPYTGVTVTKNYVITNKPDPSLTINKKNAVSRNTNVTGAQFTVYVKDSEGHFVTYPVGGDPMVIDKTNEPSGKFLPATLPEGYDGYYFNESKTPDNYLNPNSEGACAEYNRLDPPESGQPNKYIWDANSGKTFVKGTVTDTQNVTFTFYNVPNTGSVKVVKLVDGAPATEKGFPVEIKDGSGNVVKSGSTTISSGVNSVTLTSIKIYNADGTKIQYTVKEGTLTGDKANTYYLVSDGQTFVLEPGQTVTVDNSEDGNTLTINNATYIKVTGTKFKLDTWQYAHGGFTETMSGVTVRLYRRAMVKSGDTMVPYGDGKWKPTDKTTTTDTNGLFSFDKLIRGEKIGDTEVQYEYAVVEMNSNDPDYFPFINGKVKDDGYPANGTDALNDADLFGANAKYNALPLRVDNIKPVGGSNDYTTDGKTYKLGDMLNGNHWVQFDITKWLDSRTLQENIDQGITPMG